MKPVTLGETIELHIDRLSYNGGRGVGRYNNYVIFVEKTAPLELVRAKITTTKKNFAEAELVEVLKASPWRRKPPCPVAGVCGGCVWQHLEYEEQVRQKKGFIAYELREHIKDLAVQNTTKKLADELIVIPSEKEFRYRNRVQVHVHRKGFGFFASQSHDLVPIQDCLISDERLFQNLKLENKDQNPVRFELAIKNEIREVRDLRTHDSEFTQVNAQVNQELIQYVIQKMTEFKKSNSFTQEKPFHLYDLYCGDGNITFPLANAFSEEEAKIVGVEFSKSAIERAKSKNTIPYLHFLAEDVAVYLKKLKSADNSVFILDPPRAGLSSDIIQHTLRLAPDLIVYVSCNLASLKRDLTPLKALYRLTDLRGFDMFPQTELVETVVILQRN